MFKIRAVAIVAALIISILLLCSFEGNNVTGTWYPICSNSETAPVCLEIDSDGFLTSDGIMGKWEKRGNELRVSLFGINSTYRIGKYEGYEVLYAEENWQPVYCNDAKNAKILSEQ